MNKTVKFPSLSLDEWRPTKETLHLFTQIVGKIRMTLTPPQNHWWHVPLYVNTFGIGTGPIPYDDYRFEINFDFKNHKLNIAAGTGLQHSFDLYDGLTVSEFYENVFEILSELEIITNILAKPYDQPVANPKNFAKDKEHKHYDKIYVERYWYILVQVDRIFKMFNQNFCGKVCPVQLYWHSFDLAVTRFSGKKAPALPNAGPVEKEAYSHEVISFGFWPGDNNITDAAFYSYTYPAPDNLTAAVLKPDSAHWIEQNGSPLAILVYDDMRRSTNPEKTLLEFLESAYQAGKSKANWDTATLEK
ncbi:MAG: DUF5996 family protein [Balneolaceae bacterium]|jgi:hypothetical protein